MKQSDVSRFYSKYYKSNKFSAFYRSLIGKFLYNDF